MARLTKEGVVCDKDTVVFVKGSEGYLKALASDLSGYCEENCQTECQAKKVRDRVRATILAKRIRSIDSPK